MHEALHIKANLPCAIKTVSKQLLESRADGALIDLMRQELHALDRLEHPHIVRVLDLCEDHYNIYIVLELMHCGTLTKVLDKY